MINTLDLDLITKEELKHIIDKLKLCPFHCLNYDTYPIQTYSIQIKDTMKGYHVKFECLEECDNCRLVFDDDKRYAIDRRMPLKFRDFLFASKVPLGELPITKDNLEKIKDLVI